MKRFFRQAATVLVICTILICGTGCSGSGETTDPGRVIGEPESGKVYTVSDGRLYYLSLKLSEYVTVSQYTGLTASVSDSGIRKEAEAQLREIGKANAALKSSGTVEKYDTAVCDYTVFVDGKEVISRTNAQIEVLENEDGVISALAESLIGVTVGKKERLPVVFPADYQDPALSGKRAEFEVTVKYYFRYQLTDDLIRTSTNGKYQTIDEYRAALYEECYQSASQTALWTEIMKHVTIVQYPEGDTDYYYQYYKTQIESQNPGMSYEEYLTAADMTDEQIRDMARQADAHNLALYSIVQLLGIKVYESDYTNKLNRMAEDYISYMATQGITVTLESAKKYMEERREYLISECTEEKVFAYLLSHNTVTKSD